MASVRLAYLALLALGAGLSGGRLGRRRLGRCPPGHVTIKKKMAATAEHVHRGKVKLGDYDSEYLAEGTLHPAEGAAPTLHARSATPARSATLAPSATLGPALLPPLRRGTKTGATLRRLPLSPPGAFAWTFAQQ